jgi:SAM-dependent methyltransferase
MDEDFVPDVGSALGAQLEKTAAPSSHRGELGTGAGNGPRDAQTFDEAYFRTGFGPIPYERNSIFLGFFASIVDQLVRGLSPRSVLDAGCALGMVVEAFWDRGIEAHGIDISAYAISHVRPDMRPYCRQGSLVDPIEGRFDLVTCIEVLEHMPAADARTAVANLTSITDIILFSSSPNDFSEVTHVNVCPPRAWLQLFAEHGFWPDITYDASFVAPHAMLLRRRTAHIDPDALLCFVERLRLRGQVTALEQDLTKRQQQIQAEIKAKEEALHEYDAARGERDALFAKQDEIERSLAARDARVMQLNQALADGRMRVESLQAAVHLAEARHASAISQDDVKTLEAGLEEARAWRTLHEPVLLRAQADLQRLFAIEASTSWRMTGPLRRGLGRLNSGTRRNARLAVRAMVWLSTPHRLSQRIRALRSPPQNAGPDTGVDEAERQRIEASALFDRKWYCQQYPDVLAAGVDPVLHYLRDGAREGRDPGPAFSTRAYLLSYPEVAKARINPLAHYLEFGCAAGLKIAKSDRNPVETPGRAAAGSAPAIGEASEDAVDQHYGYLRPLPTFFVPELGGPRVTMVTDSINPGWLFGGVATAIVFCALLAKRLGATLRLVTIRQPAMPNAIGALLQSHGIMWDGNIEFRHADLVSQTGHVDVSPRDLFVTTSWWSTANVLKSVDPDNILYILQEDERLFYPHGDQRLCCAEILSDRRLRFVVNTRMLYDYFVADGFDNLRERGTWFEPSFPLVSYSYDPLERMPLNFFFYARPNNERNLYWRGLQAIARALSDNVLPYQDWVFHFVGRDLKNVVLPHGLRPCLHENLRWSDYASLIRRMDLGLSLMYTPHPSYPPLDLAASGAAVVTNRFGPKQSLRDYSSNILCVDDSVDALVQGIAQGAALAADSDLRRTNYENQGICRDWSASFEHVFDFLGIG